MFYIWFKKNFIEKMNESLISSYLVSYVSESLRSLTKNEWCEGIAHFAHQKWATKSNLLRLLRGNERLWANRSGCSPKMSEWGNCSFFKRIAHSLIFGQKTSDSLRNLMSEFPTLQKESWVFVLRVTPHIHSDTVLLSCVQVLILVNIGGAPRQISCYTVQYSTPSSFITPNP